MVWQDLGNGMQMALATVRTQGGITGWVGEQHLPVGHGGRCRRPEERAAVRQAAFTLAVDEKAVATNAMKAGRQHMAEEAPDEFRGAERHGLVLAVAIIVIAEGDGAVGDGGDAVVGNGDAVDVAAEIAQQDLGFGEGALGVDDPRVLVEGLAQCRPAVRILQLRLAREVERPCDLQRLQGFNEFLPEHRRQGFDRKQEVFRRADEPAAVVGQHAAGDDAVDMRMVVERLAPGVEYHDDPQAPAPAVLRKGLQGLGGNAEQEVVDQQAVVAGQRQQGFGKRKDDVEVLDGQQVAGACFDPGAALAGAAFRAVTVAAGVVANFLIAALVALIDVPTQFLGPAIGQRGQGRALLAGQGVLGTIGRTVVPEQVADFKRGVGRVRRHRLGAGVGSVAVHANSIAADADDG